MSEEIAPTTAAPAVRLFVAPLGAGALVAAVVGLAGAPWWLTVAAFVVIVVVGTVVAAMAGRGRHDAIDPFALREPWRQHLRHVLSARRRFAEARRVAGAGPRAERLAEIETQVVRAVEYAWIVARRGQDIADTRRAIAVERARRLAADTELDESRRGAARAQVDAHDRLLERERATAASLARLEERLREAAARAGELALGDDGAGPGLDELVSDVDGVVEGLEALRRAVTELETPGLDTPGLEAPGGDDPRPLT